jgi:hypothetical protein
MRPLSVLSEIEEKILSLEAELLDLKRLRNDLVPIGRLPSELLVHIFLLVQDGSNAENPPDDEFSIPLIDHRWSRVMLVCCRFRTLAIQSPKLWNVVNHAMVDRISKWGQICEYRSAGTPSYTYIRRADDSDSIHRAWKAKVEDNAATPQTFNVPAIELRFLTIDLGNRFPQLAITESFLGGDELPLTHLKLRGHQILLQNPPPMPYLHRLVLCQITVGTGLQGLSALLQNAPLIEHLSFEFLYLSESRAMTYPSTIIPVPRRVALAGLKTLLVKDTVAEVSALIRLLPIPSLTLGVEVLHYGDDDATTNYSFIAEFYVSFIKSTTHGTSDHMHNHIIVDCIHANGLNSIHFGRTLSFGLPANSAGSLVISDAPQILRLPIFDYVDTLWIKSYTYDIGDHLANVSLGTDRFPNLHTVILEYLRDMPDEEARSGLKDWIKDWRGRIQYLGFASCDSTAYAFYQEMQREEVGIKVFWNP